MKQIGMVQWRLPIEIVCWKSSWTGALNRDLSHFVGVEGALISRVVSDTILENAGVGVLDQRSDRCTVHEQVGWCTYMCVMERGWLLNRGW